MERIEDQIEQLLVTWDEDEAQALWDSLGDPNPIERGEPPPLAPLGLATLPTGKRPPRETPQTETIRTPAIACLKMPPSARIAERKLQALMGEPPTAAKHRHTRTKIRPAPWAVSGFGPTKAGDDSASSGISKPKLRTIEVNQATSGANEGRTPPSLTPTKAGDDSAASGVLKPTKTKVEVNQATSRDDTRPTSRVLAQHRRVNPSAPSGHTPARPGEGRTGRKTPGLRIITDEPLVPPITLRIKPKAPRTTGNHPEGTDTRTSIRPPQGNPTIPPTSASRSDGIPPVRVPISAGRIVEVPYHAVHVSRKYRVYLQDGLWKFRFSVTGNLISARKV